MSKKQSLLPMGLYYICDPCYIVTVSNWDNFCDTMVDGKFNFNGYDIVLYDTKYGDGEYSSNKVGSIFPVDSGCIAAIPYDANFLINNIPPYEYYLYAVDSDGIICDTVNGTLLFGDLKIYTNDETIFDED